jgi:type IV pilus assembly protein PilZ
VSHAPAIFSLVVPDSENLRRFYLDFVVPGGIFIPTDKPLSLNDRACLLLSLKEPNERFAVEGRVVWITPANAGLNRPQGVGLQFIDADPRLVTTLNGRFEALDKAVEEKPGVTF